MSVWRLLGESHCLICRHVQGVGRATAALFAKNGYNVVIAARNPDKLSAAQAQLERQCAPGRACLGIATDITDVSAVEGLVATVTEQCESVDILINCAGTLSVLSAASLWVYADLRNTLVTCTQG